MERDISAAEYKFRPSQWLLGGQIMFVAFGGMEISVGNFTLGGIGLAGVAGVMLNLILPQGASD